MAKIIGKDVGDVPGTFKDYGGGTVPQYYLLCDGSAISRTTYKNLFAKIGIAFGPGDGSTTFNLPNSFRQVYIGSGGTQISGPGTAVGNQGGEEAHLLAASESGMPVHNHAENDENWMNVARTDTNEGLLNSGVGAFNCTTNTPGGGERGTQFTQNSSALNASSAHNTMQPSLVVTKMIKY